MKWWAQHYGDYALSLLTPALIVEGRDQLRNGKRKPATVNHYLKRLSTMLTTAREEWGWLRHNPMTGVKKLKEPRGRVRFLDDDERARLLKACKESGSRHLYAVVVLALSTGMRQGEILSLRWSDVDFGRQLLTIQKTEDRDRRTLPLTGHALEVLRKHSKVRAIDNPLVFPGDSRQGHAEGRMSWYGALRRAQIDDFMFHDL